MTKVIIADDHQMVARGLESMLNESGKYQVLAITNNGRELLESRQLVKAELILIDYNMPILNGADTLEKLKDKGKAKLVFISANVDEWLVNKVKTLGADGIICKSVDSQKLVALLDKIMDGEKVFPSDNEIFNSLYQPLKKKYKLTEAETNTIKQLNQGLCIKEIADKNCVTTETIKTHKKNAFVKLGIKKVTLLAQFIKRL